MKFHKFCAKCQMLSVFGPYSYDEDSYCPHCGTKLRKLKDVVLEGDNNEK